MIQYSVLIPQRDAGDDVARQLPELCQVLRTMGSFEIICIDDGSSPPSVQTLEHLIQRYAELRFLRSETPAGLSAALGAGIAAAAGEIVILCEAGGRYPATSIPHFVAQLNRCDLVYGHRRLRPLSKFVARVLRLPRWLLLGLDVRDPGCLFWAARREAVEGLQLSRGMYRYLASLVSMRGFRVNEQYVEAGSTPLRYGEGLPNPVDLLTVWWLRRRWTAASFEELRPAATQPRLKLLHAADDAELRKRA